MDNKPASLTLASALIVRAIRDGHCYGFEIMEATGLPSGTIYPALRRLEESGLIRSATMAVTGVESGGPPRRYFRITAEGKRAVEAAGRRFPVLAEQRNSR